MDQYILELESSYRCFESFLNLSDLVGASEESIATEGFSIKESLSKVVTTIKNFFKRLWATIVNFWAKIFGKQGKLLNVRAANLITNEMNYYDKVMKSILGNIIKATKVSEFIGSKDVSLDASSEAIGMETKMQTLLDRVQKEVLNSPKLADYKYYKKEALDTFENTIKQAENTVTTLIKTLETFDFSKLERNPDFNVNYTGVITKHVNTNFSYIIKVCSQLTSTVLQAIDAATYKSEKENSKIEFEEIEVEIDPELL